MEDTMTVQCKCNLQITMHFTDYQHMKTINNNTGVCLYVYVYIQTTITVSVLLKFTKFGYWIFGYCHLQKTMTNI